MRIVTAAIAASCLATVLGASLARAADAPESYYDEGRAYEPAYGEDRIERGYDRRVVVEEPSWRRVEIERPIVEERVVVRRRYVEDAPRWRRVQIRDERRWSGFEERRHGVRARAFDEDAEDY